MSMDFAVVTTAAFDTASEARRISSLLDGEPGGHPPTAVLELLDDLDRIDAMGEAGFLSIDPDVPNRDGLVLCTRWSTWLTTVHTLLNLTKDRGLAVVDMQRDVVFDPRGRVDVHVEMANRATFPYLTRSLIADLMDRQDHYGDHMVIERADQHFIQALYRPGRECVIEYRDGGPEHHFRTHVPDRTVTADLLWAWVQHGPTAELLNQQPWQPVTL